MGLSGRRLLLGTTLLAVPVFPIPGLAGRSLSLGGVARTSTGGAIIAATENTGTGDTTRRVAIARLNVDGTVDLAYGTRGISSAGLAAGSRASAVAIDPATGEAWVGVRTPSGTSEIVALDGSGDRVAGFGRGGVVRLGAALGGEPEALAWQAGRLFVAFGGASCHGCQAAAILNPTSGRQVSREGFTGQGTCAVQSVTSAVFVGQDSVALGTASTRGRRCDSTVIFTIPPPRHGQATLGIRPVPGAYAVTLAGSGAGTCAAAATSDATAIGPFGLHQPVGTPSHRAPAGRLIGVTTLGAGACGALIYPFGAHGAVVVQTRATGRATTTASLPGDVQPLGITRCNHHLLVIGDRPQGGIRSGVVAVVPVREGPHVGGGSTAGLLPPNGPAPHPPTTGRGPTGSGSTGATAASEGDGRCSAAGS